jgi:hypothetical protein
MANANYTDPANHPPPGTGPGPRGVPGGTDRSYSVDIMVCAAITAVISFVFVAMRFYIRLYIVRVLNWEDWLILLAQASPLLCRQAYKITWPQNNKQNNTRLLADMRVYRSSRLPCVADSFTVRLSSHSRAAS